MPFQTTEISSKDKEGLQNTLALLWGVFKISRSNYLHKPTWGIIEEFKGYGVLRLVPKRFLEDVFYYYWGKELERRG